MGRFLVILAVVPMSLLITAAASGCGGDEETKEEYQAKVERELEKTDERINELEAKIRDGTGEERRRLEREASDLKDERQAVQSKLDELRSAGADDWQEIKGDIDTALSRVNEKVDKALEPLEN
jgi:predicted RNase H-like nuclease (RuvC/YqgF family)